MNTVNSAIMMFKSFFDWRIKESDPATILLRQKKANDRLRTDIVKYSRKFYSDLVTYYPEVVELISTSRKSIRSGKYKTRISFDNWKNSLTR